MSETYISTINACLRDIIAAQDRFVLYGQNVDAGSCLGGLTRNLHLDDERRAINTQNSENTLTGVGFGLMLKGVSSAYCMKQLDFLLLGVDQLVNTWNILRHENLAASFTILAVTVDGGFSGPQSSFNGLYDLCSIADIEGYSVTNLHDIRAVLGRHFITPGFRIITCSERLFREPAMGSTMAPTGISEQADSIVYETGRDITICAYNMAFPQALEVHQTLTQEGYSCGLIGVNAAHITAGSDICNDATATGRLLILDDAKSRNKPYSGLVNSMAATLGANRVKVMSYDDWTLNPNPDRFQPDLDEVRAFLNAP